MARLGITEKEGDILPSPIPEDKSTEVLDPEMADGIDILQKRARSALEQLNSMMESSDLTKQDFNKVKDHYLEAMGLYREKRFHKSHQVAILGLQTIQVKVKDDLDNKIQERLFKAREMVEEIESNETVDDPLAIDELKNDIDDAMKAFFTNEYEKADLLSKKVRRRIMEITEPDGSSVKEKAKELRASVEKLKDMNILRDEVSDNVLKLSSAEKLIRRKDFYSARKILEQIEPDLKDLHNRTENYIKAREMDIRLTNLLERLEDSGHNLEEANKKLNYLKNYMNDDRFEDALIIGSDLDKELSSIQTVKEEMEIKRIADETDQLLEELTEISDHDSYVKRFDDVITEHDRGDSRDAIKHGYELLQELQLRRKTLKVERARRIGEGMIRNRILAMKMRSMNIDTTEFERSTRKVKDLLREGNHSEGLKDLDELIHDMERSIKENTEKMKNLTTIHRDSLEVIMDRHKEQPVMFHIRNRQIPILRKMEELGRFRSAIEGYRKLHGKFMKMALPEEKRNSVETELTECKFEIYKRKEKGMDISEPLNLYTRAQKLFTSGEVIGAEFLVEISKRYCDQFLPMSA
jgi:hypothetical protein